MLSPLAPSCTVVHNRSWTGRSQIISDWLWLHLICIMCISNLPIEVMRQYNRAHMSWFASICHLKRRFPSEFNSKTIIHNEQKRLLKKCAANKWHNPVNLNHSSKNSGILQDENKPLSRRKSKACHLLPNDIIVCTNIVYLLLTESLFLTQNIQNCIFSCFFNETKNTKPAHGIFKSSIFYKTT